MLVHHFIRPSPFSITAGIPEDICKFPVFLLGPAGLSPNTRAFSYTGNMAKPHVDSDPPLGVPDYFLFLH